MSLAEIFETFLKMTDEKLMFCVDLYNEGKLSPKARLAMEMIDALTND